MGGTSRLLSVIPWGTNCFSNKTVSVAEVIQPTMKPYIPHLDPIASPLTNEADIKEPKRYNKTLNQGEF